MKASLYPGGYVSDEGVFFPKNTEFKNLEDDPPTAAMRAILSSSEDLSCLSMELRSRITDPDTLYRLTPKKYNLLRPLAEVLKGKILEIGAGEGAMTRFLGESGARVVAVEEIPHRARVARQRTRDLGNVDIVSDDVRNIAFQDKFDVIVLLGFESYVGGLSGDLLSITNLLRSLVEILAPGGTVIIATQNKLGLKYFAGAPEDTTSIPFYGINDSNDIRGAFSLGRAELQQILNDAGLHHCRWLYPFPDYKMPTTILTEAALRTRAQHDLTPLFSSSNFDDPKGARPGTFSLDRAWGLVARNGLAEELANSFLIACRVSDDQAQVPVTSPNALAWHYSVDRHPAFAKQAVFERGPDGRLVVKRSRLTDAPAPDVPLKLILEDEDFIPGRIWSAELNRLMNRPGWTAEELGDWLRFWVEAVIASAGLDADTDLQTAEVPGRLLDAMPFNLMRDSAGAAHFFDLEWESKLPLTMRHLAYRGLSKALTRITSCAEPAKKRYIVFAVLIKDVLRHAGLRIDIHEMRNLEWEDRNLQNMAIYGFSGGNKPSLLRFYLRLLKIRSGGAVSLTGRMVGWARRFRS